MQHWVKLVAFCFWGLFYHQGFRERAALTKGIIKKRPWMGTEVRCNAPLFNVNNASIIEYIVV